MENKTALRARIKADRKTIDIVKVSNIISAKICKHPAFIVAKNVMLYYPMKYEISLLNLLEEKKNFYFPKVDGDNLLVCPACKEFNFSKLKINEPCSSPVCSEILDLIIVPALAVDKAGNRLGYGGGFYDRFLSRNPDIPTLTPIHKHFVFEQLPVDELDVKVKFILTD